ncbi:MAG: heparinase II/III family protein [Bacteroidia bacterium]|nr:heparinase II/III family protein [Bacteroidia bacterium]
MGILSGTDLTAQEPMEGKQSSKFAQQLAQTQKDFEKILASELSVPLPKDMAGGFSHEQHKRNWIYLQTGANLYTLTGEAKYANFVKNLLFAYTDLYPGLGLHPSRKSYAPGKLFWQCLNDANWLLFASEAYGNIRASLSMQEQEQIEQKLIKPMADFLSIENPRFFSRIHNHSTWACAAVGMAGLAMDDSSLVSKALYGLKHTQSFEGQEDNDGGLVKTRKEEGFLAQLDFAFSPDGFFSEGPYYHRYAIYPYLIFAKELNRKKPELQILAYRDSILKRAIFSLLNQTDANGLVFPINDAQKGMSWNSRGMIAAVNIGYAYMGKSPVLLEIASKQDKVMLTEAGRIIAKDLQKSNGKRQLRPSISFRDGWDGSKGGLTILRAASTPDQELCMVLKYSSHGGGHGHFDRLSYSLYDEQGEVFQDYGAARWVNIDQKGGGRYLPENKSFSKHTIAHNTVIVNRTSQNNGKIGKAEDVAPYVYHARENKEDYDLVSVVDSLSYKGVKLHRTVIMLKDPVFPKPLLVDLFRGSSGAKADWELPFWYMGQMIKCSPPLHQEDKLQALGKSYGYQHIWLEAMSNVSVANNHFSWMANKRIYTMYSWNPEGDKWFMGRLGANDSNFNLRRDPVLIQSKEDKKEVLFINCIEAHGSYDYASEIPASPYGMIEGIEKNYDSKKYLCITIMHKSGRSWRIIQANENPSEEQNHKLEIDSRTYTWKGPYHIITKSKNANKDE